MKHAQRLSGIVGLITVGVLYQSAGWSSITEAALPDVAEAVTLLDIPGDRVDLCTRSIAAHEPARAFVSEACEPDTPEELPPVSPNPQVTTNGNSQQRAALEEWLASFAERSMDLPDFAVTFHDDRAGCAGHPGLFDFNQRPWALQVCSEFPYVIGHEIAHAWERANVTTAEREAYMKARGITVWQDLTLPGAEQGIEDIAIVIQKALQLGPGINHEVDDAFSLLLDTIRDQRAAPVGQRSPTCDRSRGCLPGASALLPVRVVRPRRRLTELQTRDADQFAQLLSHVVDWPPLH